MENNKTQQFDTFHKKYNVFVFVHSNQIKQNAHRFFTGVLRLTLDRGCVTQALKPLILAEKGTHV